MENRMHSEPHIWPIPILNDNYVWVIEDGKNSAVVVDPGVAAPVLEQLKIKNLQLKGILLTHHHHDHIGGVEEILNTFPVPVYAKNIDSFKTINVDEKHTVTFPDLPFEFSVLSIPGHTKDHVAYYLNDALFCGDTLFSAGCGRLLGGTAEQLYHSLKKIAELPNDTRVYCTHEYTYSNLLFAKTVDKNNIKILEYLDWVVEKRARNEPTLPSTIEKEKLINPFLRCDQPEVISSIEKHFSCKIENSLEGFTCLRQWKDNFK